MSDKSAIEKKKEHARLLYTHEKLNQKETAKRAGVTEKTIGSWIKLYEWDKMRAALTITKEQQLRMMYSQLNEINVAISEREEGKRYASSKEADTINKLASSIKSMENDAGIAETISVFMEFSNWCRTYDSSKANEIVELHDAFIKTKLK